MKNAITAFQVGLINKLVKRGKVIEKEVFNAIVGYKAIKEDLTPQNIEAQLQEIYPITLYNRMVYNPSCMKIKQEP